MWIRGAEDELINLDSVNHIFAGEDRGNAVLCVCINGDSQETSIYGFDCDEDVGDALDKISEGLQSGKPFVDLRKPW